MSEDPRDFFAHRLLGCLQRKPDLVAKIGAICRFEILGPSGGVWSVDCSRPGGAVVEGALEDTRCTVSCSDGDFTDIFLKGGEPWRAFLMGKLQIQGELRVAIGLQLLARDASAEEGAGAPLT